MMNATQAITESVILTNDINCLQNLFHLIEWYRGASIYGNAQHSLNLTPRGSDNEGEYTHMLCNKSKKCKNYTFWWTEIIMY